MKLGGGGGAGGGGQHYTMTLKNVAIRRPMSPYVALCRSTMLSP